MKILKILKILEEITDYLKAKAHKTFYNPKKNITFDELKRKYDL